MKKYNNYKKYYESHKEQEKQRTGDYYWANREEILAKKREKRKNAPKKVKIKASDYKKMWLTLKSLVIMNLNNSLLKTEEDSDELQQWQGVANCLHFVNETMSEIENKFKEMLKDE